MRSPSLAAATVTLLVAVSLIAGTETSAQTTAPHEIVFVPPALGAPGNRVGAGTRGGTVDTGGVILLAPRGGGMTASPSPTLYWWLDRPFTGNLSVTIAAADATRPLIATRDTVDLPAGQHAFAVDDYGLRLAEGTIYRWSVTLESAAGGTFLGASSFVEVAGAPAPAENAEPAAEASRQAAAGHWYDAFALVAEDPSSASLRASLLKQVGISVGPQ